MRVITLNRPASRNALNEALHEALLDAIRQATNDVKVRAIVLSGAGEVFCAGGDRELILRMRADSQLRRKTFATSRSLFQALIDTDVPVIAAVNGPAIGAGCSLAVMADFIIMAEGSYFADPRAQFGLLAGDGGAVLWPLLIGLPAARRFLIAGEPLSALEADSLSLLYKLCPPAQVVSEAIALAERIAAFPASGVRGTKRALAISAIAPAMNVFEYALAAEERGIDDVLLPKDRHSPDE